MKPNRFYLQQKARSIFRAIEHQLGTPGGFVQVTTYTRSTIYRSIDWFKLGKSSVYVRRGKLFDCIDGCGISFGREVRA